MTPRALITPARLAGAPLLGAQSDERLVDLVRAGNDAAFEAIVTRYRRPLLRYCTRFLSANRAEDAVQTAFMSALSSLRSTDSEINLRPWLYRIAHNSALNGLRDRSLQHEQISEQIDGVQRPDQAFEGRERLGEVLAAVEALPDRQRDALVLREFEGRPYEEIASELGVSGGSVRQLLNRARNTLRAGLTAVTPFGLLARVPWAAGPSETVSARVAEICAGGAGAAVLTKVCATALVTGAVVGGVASSPSGGIDDGRARGGPPEGPRAAPAVMVPSENGSPEDGRPADSVSEQERGDAHRGRRGRSSEDGRGSDHRRRLEEEDRSGSDSGGSSGSGSSGSGSSGSSGSGSNGSGGSGSNGSGSSGSGSSGSGSSGSGSSGSGSSGSGSSGSGSLESGSLESGSSGSGSLESGSSGSGSNGSGSSGSDSDTSSSGPSSGSGGSGSD